MTRTARPPILAFLLVLLLGLALGAGAGARLASSPNAPLAERPVASPSTVSAGRESASAPVRAAEIAPTASPRSPVHEDDVGEAPGLPSPLFSELLLEHHARQFLAGWHEVRPLAPDDAALEDGTERFRDGVLALSERLGAEMARAANERDASRDALNRSESLGLLLGLEGGTWQPEFEDLEEGLLERIVAARSAGGSIDSTQIEGTQGPILHEGIVLNIGPGVHALDERRLRGADGGSFPRDVTLVGAGMNATLLTLGDISPRGPIERLSFRDLTLDAGNDGLFDQRRGGALLDLLRVRVVRFDAGHGGCKIFNSRGGALIRAESCEFIGGYGRSPGRGHLFSSGQTFVAQFTRCHFELVQFNPAHLPSASRVEFRDSSLRLLPEVHAKLERETPAFRCIGCVTDPVSPMLSRDELQKDLRDLFPGFTGR